MSQLDSNWSFIDDRKVTPKGFLFAGISAGLKASNKKDLALKIEAKKNFEMLNNKNYTIKKFVTENNDLYGSVKPTEIAKIIKEQDKVLFY